MIYASKKSQAIKQYIERQGWDKPKLIRRLEKLMEGDVYLIDTLSDIPLCEARAYRP